MKTWLVCIVCLLLLVPGSGLAAEGDPAQTEEPSVASTDVKRRKPIPISESSILPLRVLTRTMSTLYQGPDENSGVVQGNPQGWVTLNEGADADESVYPIPLDLLP